MSMLRKGKVLYKGELAGYLFETAEGFTFEYDQKFLNKELAISVSLPTNQRIYYSKELFSFFKGLLPEGWYLNIVSMTQKIDEKDHFGLLLANANIDTIGAVTVIRME
jgi:serine/threonine-protein kinase HipA